VEGGNAGMTKGGTGDVLAGLIAALACKNDPFFWRLSPAAIINKAAGDDLFRDVGTYFNASDLANQIPRTMAKLLR
jgi:NAD(P)H-hydrate repair Nnr-like enzyme with NAD(P)H-hydrate dehydratase domain